MRGSVHMKIVANAIEPLPFVMKLAPFNCIDALDGSKPGTPGSKFNDDPEIIELHEELHHVESHQYEEKQRIENRIKWRMCVQA